jgi:UrcA family protein
LSGYRSRAEKFQPGNTSETWFGRHGDRKFATKPAAPQGETGKTPPTRLQETVMKFAVVIATSFLAFSSLAAQATTPADVDSVEVHFGDLNLDRKAGIVTLYQRIKGASKRVCKALDGQTIVSKSAYATCVDRALSTAIARIDRPMLSQYLAQQSGKPVADTTARVAVR